MPELIEEFGEDKKLDVILSSGWKDYSDILEDPFKVQGFIKISKKGLKTMTTVPLQLLLEAADGEWKQIREGMIQLKADVDFHVKNGVLEYKPDVGIKKLLLVDENEEKTTE